MSDEVKQGDKPFPVNPFPPPEPIPCCPKCGGVGHCGRSRGAVAAGAKIALDKARDKWDNSHMSTKRKEIRIRKVERVSYIRIAAAAAEAELSVPTFCLYAALAVCDTADQAERGKEPKA